MKLEALTSLRFFAALMVLCSHLRFLAESDSSLVKLIYDKVFWEGYIGVTFFFILSGFILSFAYQQRLQSQQIGFWEYMSARIARIYPLHIVTWLLALPLVFFLVPSSTESLATYLANGVLIQSYFPDRAIHFSANIPSWSLSDEMFFYLLFPFLLRCGTRVLLGLVVVLLAWHFAIALSELSGQRKHFYNYVFPLARLLDFVIGLLLFRWYKQVWKPLPESKATLIQVGALGLLAVFFAVKGVIPQALRFDVFYILPMALVIAAFATDRGLLAKALQHRILVLLGEASFALYLTHHLVIRYAEVAADNWGWPMDAVAATVLLVVAIIVSVVCYLGFERRLHRWALSQLIPLGKSLDHGRNTAKTPSN
ncbi:acyltransferase family protein [Teredinibacter turnerae]|uniref:acyltransferase family protein n=1 Tax=Teredinibacter turnerae TaxID=2426 RepID=UPI0005F86CBB|nr:acyltransferase [Teredinibacter turnerae]